MKEKKNKSCESGCSRLNKVGGQAVLEGVMMKAGERTVTTCRKEDGSISVSDGKFVSIRKKLKFLNIPILRGVINFFEMMKLSIKTLGASADAMGLDEEQTEGKFASWLKRKLGIRITDLVMVISVILGLGLSVLLFLFLPIWVTAGINLLLELCEIPPMGAILTAVVEGLIKVSIFVIYLASVSLMPDIKRTFMYHGAEHKSIACFESGDELTPKNAMRHTRFHPRCGTSFMFFMILLGIFAGIIIKTLIPGLPTWLYTVIRLGILPIVMGIGYEIIMLAGKHDNLLTRMLSAPGKWMQKITTKEPTEDMLEIAIISIKCALRDDFPEFKEFYDSRAWEPKPEESATDADASAETSEAATETSEAVAETNEAAAQTSESVSDTDITANTSEAAADTSTSANTSELEIDTESTATDADRESEAANVTEAYEEASPVIEPTAISEAEEAKDDSEQSNKLAECAQPLAENIKENEAE